MDSRVIGKLKVNEFQGFWTFFCPIHGTIWRIILDVTETEVNSSIVKLFPIRQIKFLAIKAPDILKLSAQPYGRPNAKYAHFFTCTRYLMCM